MKSKQNNEAGQITDFEYLNKINDNISNRGSLSILYILYIFRRCKYSEFQKLINISFGALFPTLERLMKADLVCKDEYTKIFTLTECGKSYAEMFFDGGLMKK